MSCDQSPTKVRHRSDMPPTLQQSRRSRLLTSVSEVDNETAEIELISFSKGFQKKCTDTLRSTPTKPGKPHNQYAVLWHLACIALT